MTKVLRNIIRDLLIQEARPKAAGAKPHRSGRGFGGRRVYDKKTGEAFDVVDFIPRDPQEEVQKVVLKSRKTDKETKVSYNDYLGKYTRHVGQPVQTAAGSESPNVAAWAWHELKGQGGAKGASEYESGPMMARGAVGDKDPATGKRKRLPSPYATVEGDPFASSEAKRKDEMETAMDKIDLVASNEALYDRLVGPYIDDYKDALKPSIIKARNKLKEYGVDMMRSGELDPSEIEWFKKTDAATVFAAIWELPGVHEDLIPEMGIPGKHVSSISSIVNATGKLSVDDLDDERADGAIKGDPGFKAYLAELGNDDFWNKLRWSAEEAGKYRGQY